MSQCWQLVRLRHGRCAMNQAVPAAVVTCVICHKPVPLETAKTDERGKTVHEECYVSKMKLERATEEQKP